MTWVDCTIEDQFREEGNVRKEYNEDEAFVGPLRNHPAPSFWVVGNLFEGYFVAVRPSDGDGRPIWIARALSNPNSNRERPNTIFIHYFHSTISSNNVQEFYTGSDSPNGLRWKVDDNQGEVWESIDSIMTAWKSKIKKDTMQCTLKIPLEQIKIIHESLAVYHNANF